MVELQREINISTLQWDFKKPFIINFNKPFICRSNCQKQLGWRKQPG